MKHILVGLILAVFSTALTAQIQTLTALLNSSPSSIELQGESYISYGCVENNHIILQEIPIEENGYLEFSFANLKSTDNISIGFENTANTNEYYRFEYNGGAAVTQEHNQSPLAINSTEKNNNTFKLIRCGNNISFFEQGDTPIQSITTANDTKLWAKIQVNTAEDVLLYATFEPNYTDCPKCADAEGSDLYINDLELTGISASTNNQISLENNVPLSPGTHFTVAETVYEAGGAVAIPSQSWYSGDGVADGQIASQKITYTGNSTLPSGSTICFSLPSTGTGDALLATNFLVNGFSSTDFCVVNNGNTPDPKINMGNSITALFILQGAWTFSNQRGLFHGQHLDAYQHIGAFLGPNETNSNLGHSRLPSGLDCLVPNSLPSASCGGGSGSLIAEDSDETTILETRNTTTSSIKSHIYPNPFEQSFSLALTLSHGEQVRIALLNARGQEIHRLPTKRLKQGIHHFVIQPKQTLSPGLYFLHIQTEQNTLVEKVVQQAISSTKTNK